MATRSHGMRYLIWRDGMRWQFFVEGEDRDRTGWRPTEHWAKRAAHRRARRAVGRGRIS
jgi:hypothetical protein